MRGLFLLTLVAVCFAVDTYEIKFRKKKKIIPEYVEYSNLLAEIQKEGYSKIPEGLEVRKDCKIERGIASWYGGRFHGRKTASGEVYNLYKFTAASRTLPLGTYVLVVREDNGKMVVVRINDRGPYVKGRIIDLSRASAHQLNMVKKGISRVTVIPLRCLSPNSLKEIYDRILIDIVKTR